jgi:hypothetical protein
VTAATMPFLQPGVPILLAAVVAIIVGGFNLFASKEST